MQGGPTVNVRQSLPAMMPSSYTERGPVQPQQQLQRMEN